jgi:hypothetical protein
LLLSWPHIADALGLTVLHVLRTISALKRAELTTERNGSIQIIDRLRSIRLNQFDDYYLHNWRLSFRFSMDEADDQVVRAN